MITLKIHLTDDLRRFVDEQVSRQGHDSRSEYLGGLIRKERDRQHLRQLLMDGAVSATAKVADEHYFAGLRERVRKDTE